MKENRRKEQRGKREGVKDEDRVRADVEAGRDREGGQHMRQRPLQGYITVL